MVRVILVRHGETDWNRQEVFRGRVDVKLNQAGIQQAEAVAKTLGVLKIDAIYSSPLSRALETAKIIAGPHGLNVKALDGFIDFNFGQWQGLADEEVRERYKELYEKWRGEPHKVRILGGEGLDDVRKRSTRALDNLLSQHGSGTIAIVSHRVVNKILLCAVLGLDNSHFWQIKQDPCAINIFDYTEDGFVISLLNDTCHLGTIRDKTGSIDF